jgi:hypothetical protein
LKDMRGNLSFTHLYAHFHPIRAICYDWRQTTGATVVVIFDVRIVIIAGTLFSSLALSLSLVSSIGLHHSSPAAVVKK